MQLETETTRTARPKQRRLLTTADTKTNNLPNDDAVI